MARQSFRLRRDTATSDSIGVGSFNRGTSAIQKSTGVVSPDQDSSIRSTGLILASIVSDNSFFEASASDYEQVKLKFLLTEGVVDVNDIEEGETKIIGVRIVHSYTGYPENVLDGTTIKEASSLLEFTAESDPGSSIVSYRFNHENVQSNKWSYYSLFVLYNQSGVDGSYWYERVAYLEELVPDNKGSQDAIWKRIPVYYREQDTKWPVFQDGSYKGQLERMVKVFGFEVDRTRTLFDSVMTGYDPQSNEAESLNQIAMMMGLEVGIEDVGVSKVRSVLKDIGHLRRRKGTIPAVKEYISALTNSRVDVFTSASAPFYTFAVHAERANLIADPVFETSGGGIQYAVYSENSTTTASAIGGITITAGGTGTKVALVTKLASPDEIGTPYYMSFDTISGGASFSAGWANAASAWASWSTVFDSTVMSGGSALDRSVWQMEPNTDLNNEAPSRYPAITFYLGAGQSITLRNWMVEPYRYGGFFYGNSYAGGFLYNNTYKDIIWSGTESQSYSVYTTNRVKTYDAVERLLPQLLPVTLLGGVTPKYDVLFDWIPGKSL